MKGPVKFLCTSCGNEHVGIPGWSYPFPMPYFDVPEAEREVRCYLSSDLCVVDDSRFFIRGCLEVPLNGYTDCLVIGAWSEVVEEDFFEYQDLLGVEKRAEYGPYKGTLSAAIPTYADTEGLPVSLVVVDNGIRPAVRLESADHPLALAQREGLSLERVQAFYTYFEKRRAAV